MSKYVLVKGRPADNEGRLEKEIRVYDLLDSLHMEYWRTDHPDAHANTMEACREIDEVLEATVCKNLFLTNRQHTKFYLLMMPGDKVFKTKELSGQIGSSRLSFGSPQEMEEMLDCTPGSSSIMGLMNDKQNRVQLLVDRDVLKGEFVGCHPCINTSSLKLRTSEVFGIFLDAVHHEMTEVTLVGDDGTGSTAS
ncbi:MAG: prolyl-tRNA synthetase associated domain-containing protein [Blautia sp.]|nr:prolyl-tRNA synthetase associated domain-containing protein [Blautia sp.]